MFMGQLTQSLFQAAPHTMLLPLLSVTQLLNPPPHSPLSSDMDCRMHMTTVETGLLCSKVEHIFDTVILNSQCVSHGESVTALVYITGLPRVLLYGICRGRLVNFISHMDFHQ